MKTNLILGFDPGGAGRRQELSIKLCGEAISDGAYAARFATPPEPHCHTPS